MKKNVFIMVFILILLLFSVQVSGADGREAGSQEKVVFEEVGQFNDGGMAVTVLVRGITAYVCEFDRGLEILDINDPTHIVKLGMIPDTKQARGIEVVKNIAYVSCNVNGLKLFDISNPSQPRYLGQYRDRDGDPHQFLTAGKIGFLTEWHGGFDIIDLSDPDKPIRLSQYHEPGMMAFSAAIDMLHAFVTGYKAGLKILNISNPKKPVLIGEFNNGGETNALQVVGSKAYVCDKLQGLEIMDVADPTKPRLLGVYRGGGSTVGVQLIDTLAFIISWEHGLHAVDVSNPAAPVKVGSFYDGGRPNGIQVVGDLIYLADGSDGLEILRFRKNKEPASKVKSQNFPVLKGPYLGQKPPGMTPEIFAPGVISTEASEGSSGFALGGTVFIYQRFIDQKCHTFIMRLNENQWSKPKLIPFWKQLIHNGDFAMSPDDKTMFYQVKTEISGRLDSDIWQVAVLGNEWGSRSRFPAPVNTKYDESFASETSDRTLYFFSRRPGGVGESDLYYVRFKNDIYSDLINIKNLNTPFHEWDPYIAPDESYLIFCSTRPGGLGQDDLYICFRNHQNQWCDPVHLDSRFNSARSENRPYVTHDGRYFFFTSSRRGNRDIYWVEAKIIERLKPKNLK